MEIGFYLLSIVLIVTAVMVVAFKNPIYSGLSLVLNLVTVAALFATLDAHFLAVVQIIVYAGAIMVLVMFVLMLLNVKIEPLGNAINIPYFLAAVFLGIIFLFTVGQHFEFGITTAMPSAALQGSVAAMGRELYTKYVFPFEAASVLIMVAVVGAIMLSKRKYRER